MMKNEPYKFTLSREAMKSITAGSSGTPPPENPIRDAATNRTNGRNKKGESQSLAEAYRRLSRRECEVLKKIAEGKTNREIADALFIAKGTVENHITRIGKAVARQKNASDKP